MSTQMEELVQNLLMPPQKLLILLLHQLRFQFLMKLPMKQQKQMRNLKLLKKLLQLKQLMERKEKMEKKQLMSQSTLVENPMRPSLIQCQPKLVKRLLISSIEFQNLLRMSPSQSIQSSKTIELNLGEQTLQAKLMLLSKSKIF